MRMGPVIWMGLVWVRVRGAVRGLGVQVGQGFHLVDELRGVIVRVVTRSVSKRRMVRSRADCATAWSDVARRMRSARRAVNGGAR
jgi:hypothetical protein